MSGRGVRAKDENRLREYSREKERGGAYYLIGSGRVSVVILAFELSVLNLHTISKFSRTPFHVRFNRDETYFLLMEKHAN
jgi:hypothetical protein